MTQPSEAPQQPQATTIVELINSIQQDTGLSSEDLGQLPFTERYIDSRDGVWKVGDACPPVPALTIVFIAEDGDDYRIYTAPLKRTNLSAEDKAKVEKGEVAYSVWRMKFGMKGLRLATMDVETFKHLMGKELTRALDELLDGNEAEAIMDYIAGLHPATGAQTILAALRAEKHLEESDAPEPPAANGAAAPQPTA